MPEFKITRVYETTFPVAHMPRPDLGQIDFSVEGETISVLLPRGDLDVYKRQRWLGTGRVCKAINCNQAGDFTA